MWWWARKRRGRWRSGRTCGDGEKLARTSCSLNPSLKSAPGGVWWAPAQVARPTPFPFPPPESRHRIQTVALNVPGTGWSKYDQ